ncbi:hypothetical protein B0H13DRAFT_2013880 [Mycena leptocephala]|nr:hypothetical protein B0H13DRAFT_2013880 [Mycena leptocephala]
MWMWRASSLLVAAIPAVMALPIIVLSVASWIFGHRLNLRFLVDRYFLTAVRLERLLATRKIGVVWKRLMAMAVSSVKFTSPTSRRIDRLLAAESQTSDTPITNSFRLRCLELGVVVLFFLLYVFSVGIVVLLYILARLFLITLPFTTLRALPPGVLIDVDWNVYIPHL